jgi:hypothetical protein
MAKEQYRKPVEVTGSNSSGATGAAVPADAVQMAGTDGTLLQVPRVLAPSDALATAISSLMTVAQLSAFDGTNQVRVRADAQKNLMVGLRSGSGVEPTIGAFSTDAISKAANKLGVYATQAGFNGDAWDLVRVANVFKYLNIAALAAAGVSTVWTPTTGKKPRVMGMAIAYTSAGQLNVRTGSAGSGTTFLGTRAAGADTFLIDLGQGKLASAANDVVEVINAGGANFDGTILIWGTEE